MNDVKGAMNRFGVALTSSGVATHAPTEQPGVAEIKALADIDVGFLPDAADLAALESSARIGRRESLADDLRVPSPAAWRAKESSRRRARVAPFESAVRCLSSFQSKMNEPAAVTSSAAEAEAKMMSLVGVILKMQDRIYALRDERKRT